MNSYGIIEGKRMLKSMNIAWWVKRWSVLHPNKTAIIFEDCKTSYLELHQKVNRTCCWLQSLGIEKGDRVAVMLKNCPEFLELYLACSRLGGLFFMPMLRLLIARGVCVKPDRWAKSLCGGRS
jgi:fatty-acyl-CoA synthase